MGYANLELCLYSQSEISVSPNERKQCFQLVLRQVHTLQAQQGLPMFPVSMESIRLQR